MNPGPLTALWLSAGGPRTLPEGASSAAPEVDATFFLILYISLFFFVGIVGTMIYFVVKYRRRSPGQRTSPNEGNVHLEIVWTIVPAVIMVGLFYIGFRTWVKMHVPPQEAIEVRVTAFKWGWEFQYPRHSLSFKELIVPKGKPVKLIMSSRDVIHSFFVPAFRVKRDVLPGRYTVMWFKPTRTGSFDIRCAEYCGTSHSRMITRVHVWEYSKWKKWYDSGGGLDKLSPIEYGKHLFTTKCSSCHSDDKSRKKVIGPPLYGIYGKTEVMEGGAQVKVDDNYLRESIMYPQKKIVKGYATQNMNPFPELSDKQLNAIIDYIKTLGRKLPTGTPPKKSAPSK